MISARAGIVKAPTKAPTGFDEITGGGLPRGRTTLLVGGPGSGKTILALQFLVHGARNCKEPGIFVAFEETAKRIVGNAESFGWKLAALKRKKLYFLDAQPTPDLIQSGNFDLSGMLAATRRAPSSSSLAPQSLRNRLHPIASLAREALSGSPGLQPFGAAPCLPVPA